MLCCTPRVAIASFAYLAGRRIGWNLGSRGRCCGPYLNAHVEGQRVEQGHIVPRAMHDGVLRRQHQALLQAVQEGGWLPRLQVAVQLSPAEVRSGLTRSGDRKRSLRRSMHRDQAVQVGQICGCLSSTAL